MTTRGYTTKDDTGKGGNTGSGSGSGSTHRWSKFEEDYLLQMKKAGKTIAQMSQEFGRTECAVYQKLNKLTQKEKEAENKRKEEELMAALRCPACHKSFDSTKKLNIHIGKKQDDDHQQLRDQIKQNKQNTNNKKNEKESKQKEKPNKKKKDHKTKKQSKKKQKKTKSNDSNYNKNTINQSQTLNLTVVTADKSAVALEQNPRKRKMSDDGGDGPLKKKSKALSKLEWNVDECAEWVKGLGESYKKYESTFRNEGVQGVFLNELLNEKDGESFKELVPSALHRSKIKHQWNRTT